MKLFKSYFVVSLLLSFTQVVTANPSAQQELIALLNNVNSFQAHFSQRIDDPNGALINQSKGEVRIKRPGKFYWKSRSPDPLIVVADGRFLWTYDIDLEQVTKQNQRDALRNSPAALLADNVEKIQNQYVIEYSKKHCESSNQLCFELKPKQQDANITSVYLAYKNGHLAQIVMNDPMGQRVRTRFSQVKVNQSISPSVFKFTPPRGVDVIENQG